MVHLELAADRPDVGAAVGRGRVRLLGPHVPAGDPYRLLGGALDLDVAAERDDRAERTGQAAHPQRQRTAQLQARPVGHEDVDAEQVGAVLQPPQVPALLDARQILEGVRGLGAARGQHQRPAVRRHEDLGLLALGGRDAAGLQQGRERGAGLDDPLVLDVHQGRLRLGVARREGAGLQDRVVRHDRVFDQGRGVLRGRFGCRSRRVPGVRAGCPARADGRFRAASGGRVGCPGGGRSRSGGRSRFDGRSPIGLRSGGVLRGGLLLGHRVVQKRVVVRSGAARRGRARPPDHLGVARRIGRREGGGRPGPQPERQ